MTHSEPQPNPGTGPAARRKLPIGIQTFSKVREEGCYYVDKTAYVRRLVDEGKYYFLSRPRRFGKSLLVDTIKELFEANEPLFRGLAIHDEWDWSTRRPVVRLDFSGNFTAPGNVHKNLMRQLDRLERRAGVDSPYDSPAERFAHLIETPARARGAARGGIDRRVRQADPGCAQDPGRGAGEPRLPARGVLDHQGVRRGCRVHPAHRGEQVLQGQPVLGAQQPQGRHPGPALLRHLRLHRVGPRRGVRPGAAGSLDRAEIRRWYNGYAWLGAEKVYNPFDILLLFDTRRFKAHWFETGSPTFLIDTLVKRGIGPLALEDAPGTDALLSAFDVDAISTEALLFQTGYLTIHGEEDLGGETRYRLGYPNREVRQSLNGSLLSRLAGDPSHADGHRIRLYELLRANDFAGLEAQLRAFFAGIPYQWRTKNDAADYEGYYASVFYALFASAGLDMTVEDSTARGRVDLTVRLDGSVYLFEFKVVGPAGPEGAPTRTSPAMAQLRERGYAEKHRGSGRPIHLIGIEFSKETRNLAAFEAAPD